MAGEGEEIPPGPIRFAQVWQRSWQVLMCGFLCKIFEALDQDLFQAFVRSLVVCDDVILRVASEDPAEFSGSAHCSDKIYVINEATDFMASFSLMNFSPRIVIYPIMGAMADVFGRRPFMLVSFLGLSLMLLSFAIAAATKNKNVVLAGGLVHGTTFFVYPLCLTMLADISSVRERNEFMAAYVMLDTLGTAVSLATSAMILDFYLTDYFNVWCSLLTVSVAAFVFVLLNVEDTRQNISNEPITCGRFSPMPAIRLLMSDKFLLLLAVSQFLLLVAFIGPLITLTPFLIAHGFTQVSALLAQGVALVATIAAVPVNKYIQRQWSEMYAVKIGLLVLMTGMLCFATLAPFTHDAVWPALSLMGAGLGLALPSLKALVSIQVGEQDQAKIQSLMGSFVLLGVTLGAFVFAKSLFDANDTGFAAGRPFFASAAVISGTTLLLAYAEKYHMPPQLDGQPDGVPLQVPVPERPAT
jgi:DHA1 family tetracycline resistance protein-like MFS transporter